MNMLLHVSNLYATASVHPSAPESLWTISPEERILLAVGLVLTIVVTIVFFRIIRHRDGSPTDRTRAPENRTPNS